MSHREISDYLQSLGDPTIAAHSQRFFKTGPGEYGQGDVFLGIRVPLIRQAVKKYRDRPLSEIAKLLRAKFHEIRLFALLVMVAKFSRKTCQEHEAIYKLYLDNTRYVNNWDLVDSSAHYIVGPYLENRSRDILDKLVRSKSLWERRIAIMATYFFIKKNDFAHTLRLANLLLDDDEDLIHKAVGWMLREIGKRDLGCEKKFLKEHYDRLPRTTLRYAIEKFPANERQRFLRGV